MNRNETRHLCLGVAILLAGWATQLIMLIFVIYAFNFILWRMGKGDSVFHSLDDATYQVLLRYVVLPLSTLLPSVIIIQAARYLSRHVSPRALYLQWLQPSVVMVLLFCCSGGMGEATLLELLVVAISGYIPLIFSAAWREGTAAAS